MADLDLILGNRGPFVPQSSTNLTLTLGPIPGSPGSHVDAFVAATIAVSASIAAVPVRHANVAATIPVSASIAVTPVFHADVAATISVSASINAEFDPNIFDYLEAGPLLPWRETVGLGVHDAYPWSGGSQVRAQDRFPWQQGANQNKSFDAPWRDQDQLRVSSATAWKDGAQLRIDEVFSWKDGAQLRQFARFPWQQGIELRTTTVFPWKDGAQLRKSYTTPWRDGAFNHGDVRVPWRDGELNHGDIRLPWRDGNLLETHGGPQVVVPVVPPNFIPTDLVFCRPWKYKNPLQLELILGLNPCGSAPTLVVVPIRSVYVVTNVTSLRRVDGDIDIPTLSMNLNLDMDSWTWAFSASVPGQALADLVPVDGMPVELEAEVNGVLFRFLAEKLTRDRTFGDSRLSIQGRGKTALLDAPYTPVMTFGNDGDRTIQQLANEVLTLNGIPIGWDVEWNLLDWLVPGGAWATQGTFVNGLVNIASAAGGYLQPHNTDQTVIFLAKYPELPWNWDTITADFELPSAVVTQEGIEWVDKVVYNRVFVSGANSHGVLGRATRNGTDGGLVAPMVTDALITHEDAVRSRGSAVLGDTGRQALVTLRLPVLEETGIIKPGKFVRYVDGATTRIGIVRSVGVSVAGQTSVWQSIEVETHDA